MRAIRIDRFGGVEALRVDEGPEIGAGPGEVLIATTATSINPVDDKTREGAIGAGTPPLPITGITRPDPASGSRKALAHKHFGYPGRAGPRQMSETLPRARPPAHDDSFRSPDDRQEVRGGGERELSRSLIDRSERC